MLYCPFDGVEVPFVRASEDGDTSIHGPCPTCKGWLERFEDAVYIYEEDPDKPEEEDAEDEK